MKQIKIGLFVFLGLALTAGCARTSYKKTPGGMPYKLFRGSDTQRVVPGVYMKLSFRQQVNDSVVFTTATGLPIYLFVSNQESQRYDISELWTSLHVGDSVVATQMMDTFINRAPQNIPPVFKRGDRVITQFKVLAVFANDSLARADEAMARKELLASESREVEKYLAEKKIEAQKTPSGAYVQILQPGTGDPVDSGKYISVNYTGTSWSGKRFDSNTDSAFHHLQPYSFVAGSGQMIRGFDEGVLFLRKGSVARIYIPSLLGYGPEPGTQLIKPFEHLIFDVEITDVKDKAPAVPLQQPAQKIDTTQQKNK